jgi:site-specific DNA recombinase
LGQDFNSLDAQRDAGTAYIRSQAGEGWILLPEQYDDGGYTGANMERPAIRRLLADVQAKKVDCVLVYKVDRLSRSIRDFAKIMEILEKHGTTFVSVTQQFNTTTSLGRLTLNILLSFAQFEREIISERTRDKQVRWRGSGASGPAATSRSATTSKPAAWCSTTRGRPGAPDLSSGISKARMSSASWQSAWISAGTTSSGPQRKARLYGGHPMHRAHIYNLLANVLYTGRIAVDGELYRGEHDAIIDEETFDLVQARLKQNSTNGDHRHRTRMESLLRGLIYCASCGSAMYQTYSSSKERRYRYYVCSRAQQQMENYCVTRSVSAPAVEDAVVESIRRVSVHPRVLEETARVIRHRLTEEIARLREELNAVQLRVKNLKSQVARIRKPDANREAELKEQIDTGEARTAELKREIVVRERARVDGDELRKTMEPFDALWKAMNIQEQSLLLRQLVEKVGYDGRTGKVTVSFKSASIKELCQK